MTSDARFEAQRATLMAIAYRMLGSSRDAEDAVQDVWLRWWSADRDSIHDDRAWLSKALLRLCIDRLTSARARRETYPGAWLPEPVLATAPMDVESISYGFLVLLERLSPVERAVLLLSKVFDYSHVEIAEALGISEAASRQWLHRARRHLDSGRPRFTASKADHERLLRAFSLALSSGDVAAIRSVLAEDAVLVADGGGSVPGVARQPVVGGQRVARFLAGVAAKVTGAVSVTIQEVNAWPALVGRTNVGVFFVMTIETDGARITEIRNVVNPEKLALARIN